MVSLNSGSACSDRKVKVWNKKPLSKGLEHRNNLEVGLEKRAFRKEGTIEGTDAIDRQTLERLRSLLWQLQVQRLVIMQSKMSRRRDDASVNARRRRQSAHCAQYLHLPMDVCKDG